MNRRSWFSSRFALVLGVLGLQAFPDVGPDVMAQEKLPEGAKLVKVEAFPDAIDLRNPFAYRQLLLTGHFDNGDRVDVTRLTRFQLSSPLVRVSPSGLVRPVADGKGELEATVAGLSVRVPVQVAGAGDRHEVSFVRDVMPAMSKLGCNAGTCHGSANGKNGFKLSLRGYDAMHDYLALTDDLEGRRLNRAAPETSLMLLKPAGGVPHVGGVLMQPGEPYYELLKLWIAEGVKMDSGSPRVARIEIFPKSPVLPLPGVKQQVVVLATYSDGTVRDVSAEAFVESSNTEVATVDKAGLVTAVRRGEAAMLARYEGAYAATTLIVMGDRSGYSWQDVPVNSWIDELVYEKLRQVKLLPSGLCSDADFIRRVYLDLTGLPPEPDVVRAFLADPRETRVKRDELVDRLVGSPEYVEHWTNKWSDLLQVNRKFLGDQGARQLRDWIRKAIADNMPYDQFVYTILTASGSNLENPPAAYFKVLREPGLAVENTTQLFLAIRFNCNKCHDHPFERWTQDQYYHLAAYFAQVSRKEDAKYKNQKIGGTAVEGAVPLVEVIADETAGEVKHDRTGAVTPPRFPFTHKEMPPDNGSRRQQLAKWVTAKDNPYFARSYVNRIWSYLLGVGIIEPVDDIRAGNPPSNPKLLDRLTAEFIQSGFNGQHLMKLICKSRVYQHSLETNRWNEGDEVNYSHALARRLPAETLYDAIHRATGSVSKLPGLPAGARAAQLLDSNVELPGSFLNLFGKPPRESACECERSSGMMLGPVLNLINGPVVADAIRDPKNRLARLVAQEPDDALLVDEIFLAFLCRPPTPQERDVGLQTLKGAKADYLRLLREHEQLEIDLAAYEKTQAARQAEWEKSMGAQASWTTLDVQRATATGDAKLARQPDGSWLASGPNPYPEVYTIVATSGLSGITGIRLEVLTDPSLPANGPGRAPNGNFVLNEFRVSAAGQSEADKPKPVVLQNPKASFSQEGFSIAQVIDGNPATGWAILPQVGKSQTAVFEFKEPVNFSNGARLTITMAQRYNGKEHNIGRFRLSVTTVKPPLSLTGPPEQIAKALATPADKRTAEQKADLTRYFRQQDAELARKTKALTDHVLPASARLIGAQDLAWALINSPAFLFNH